MTTTPNLGLTKPSVGSTGWGSDINANWDTLDSIFTAPTALQRHVYPGDDIQTAIDDVIAGGGSVIIHPGTYTFSTGLDLTDADRVSIIGFGDATLLQYTGSGVAINIALGTFSCDDILLMNFRLEATGGTPGTHGIKVSAGSNYVHKYWGLNIRNFTTAGIALDAGTSSNGFMIGNCNLTGNAIGILANDAIHGRFVNNIIFSPTTHGIQLKGASQYVKVIGNEVNGGSTAGISVEGSSTDCVIEGNTCNSQTGVGIQVDTSNRIVVSGNLVRSATGNGIKGNAATDLLIGNNSCFSCGGDGINLANVDESAINSNRCKSNTGFGIKADANCDENLYDGNHTRGNTGGGLSDSGTNSTTGTNK